MSYYLKLTLWSNSSQNFDKPILFNNLAAFDLPCLSFEDSLLISFRVDAIDDNHRFVQLKADQGELKRMHLSQLYDLQTDQFIAELKEIEDGF